MIMNQKTMIDLLVGIDNLTIKEKRYLAFNSNTQSETLAILVDDESWGVRCGVAGNPNTPPETLTRLADDKDCFVYWVVAYNPNAPPYIIEYINAIEFMRKYYES